MNKQSKSKILILILILILLFCFDLFANQPTNEIHKVVILKDWKPYYSTDKNGKPTGYAIELLELIAKKINLKYEYIVVDQWKDGYKYFEDKKASIVPNIGILGNREKLFVFTQETDVFEILLFKRAMSVNIQNISDVRGNNITVSIWVDHRILNTTNKS